MQCRWMQWNLLSMAQSILIECSGFHAAWSVGTLLNAVDFMQHGPKHPDWVHWIQWSIIECRGFHAFCCNWSLLYAVESMERGQMHPNWMHWIICSMAQSIPIECSGFHAASMNAEDSMHCGAWLNAVYSMQRGPMHPDGMQWILCSMAQSIPIECSGLYAAWLQQCNPLCSSVIHAEC